MTSIPPPPAGAGNGVISVPTALTPYLTTHTLTPTLTLPLCTPCQTAILPKSLLEHLRKQHHLPPALRVLVKEFIASLALCNDQTGRERREVDFGDVKCLNDGAGVVAGLRVVSGWRCLVMVRVDGEGNSEDDGEEGEKEAKGGVSGNGGKKKEKAKEKQCGYIRRDVTDIRRHINLVHGVGAKGMYEACVAQSWFGGRRAVYWRVDGGGGGDGGRDPGLDSAGGGEDGVGCAGGNRDRDRGGDVVMSEAGNEEGQVRVGGEGSLYGDSAEKMELHKNNELHEGKEGEGEELTKRLKTPVFTSLCRWGFYGKGFGDKTPKTWRVKDGKETEIERELRLGNIC